MLPQQRTKPNDWCYHGMIEDTVEEQRARDAWGQRRQEEEDAENKAHLRKVKITSVSVFSLWCLLGLAIFNKDLDAFVYWCMVGIFVVPLAVVSFFEKRD